MSTCSSGCEPHQIAGLHQTARQQGMLMRRYSALPVAYEKHLECFQLLPNPATGADFLTTALDPAFFSFKVGQFFRFYSSLFIFPCSMTSADSLLYSIKARTCCPCLQHDSCISAGLQVPGLVPMAPHRPWSTHMHLQCPHQLAPVGAHPSCGGPHLSTSAAFLLDQAAANSIDLPQVWATW